MKQTNMERNEAIGRLRQLYSETNAENKAALECLIPELKESEDERIRKAIRLILIATEDEQKDFYSTHGMTRKDCTDWLEKQKEQKPAEWSEEDERILKGIIWKIDHDQTHGVSKSEMLSFLISLRPQPKQESEPMEIKFAGGIYKVYGTKELPGGVVGYIIEDEPGHYDCIIHPDEVLGGGYGIKSNGSPYPTKEANFGQPHWKPSEEQMEALSRCILIGNEDMIYALKSLCDDLKKL